MNGIADRLTDEAYEPSKKRVLGALRPPLPAD